MNLRCQLLTSSNTAHRCILGVLQNWKTLSSKVVHKNPWYEVIKNDVIRPDCSEGEYYIVQTYGPSVFVVATNPNNEVLLIGQERYTNDTFSWEVPGGGSDSLEDPLVAAKRELAEESGYTTNDMSLVGKSFVMNGVCGELSYIFRATNLIKVEHNEQKEEGITQTKWASLNEIKNMIKNEEITDNQSIVAITKTFLL